MYLWGIICVLIRAHFSKIWEKILRRMENKSKTRFTKKFAIVGVILILVVFFSTLIFTGSLNEHSELDNHHFNQTENLKKDAPVRESTGTDAETLNAPDSDSTKTDTETLNAPDSDSTGTDAEARIVMVGDVLLHTPVSDSGLREDGSYNYEHLFSHVKSDIESADLALVNQEVILGGRELGLSGYPAFNGAYEVGDALVEAGFDVILHATNHALDKGKTGVLNCLNYWRTSHPQIGVVGINDSSEMQQHIYVAEVKGIKIAILNYTYGTNGIAMPADMPYAVNLLDREQIERDISKAKEKADFIIVCPHWGIEYTHEENSEQTSLAMFMAEKGANLIIGAHPHVVQPVRWVEAANGNRALVYYSLGNFINATSEYGSGVADRMIGAMADVTIIKSRQNGEVKIVNYQAVPLVTQMLTGSGRITTYKLSDYTPELAAQNEVIERDAAFSYDYCVNLFNEIFNYE